MKADLEKIHTTWKARMVALRVSIWDEDDLLGRCLAAKGHLSTGNLCCRGTAVGQRQLLN